MRDSYYSIQDVPSVCACVLSVHSKRGTAFELLESSRCPCVRQHGYLNDD